MAYEINSIYDKFYYYKTDGYYDTAIGFLPLSRGAVLGFGNSGTGRTVLHPSMHAPHIENLFFWIGEINYEEKEFSIIIKFSYINPYPLESILFYTPIEHNIVNKYGYVVEEFFKPRSWCKNAHLPDILNKLEGMLIEYKDESVRPLRPVRNKSQLKE